MSNLSSMIPRDRYFAAANSGLGFKSYFEDIFFDEGIKRRYIIKGGPGTGKSTLMKRLGARAEREGRKVVYYYCSSDTDSLDGIIIDSCIAVFDGTAPHSYDTVLPGAIDEIVDLGKFWNSAALAGYANKISRISESKKLCYKRAYRYLAAALETSRAMKLLAEPYRDTAKMRAAIARTCEKIPDGTGGRLTPHLVSAIGTRGRVRFDSLRRRASNLYAVCDSFGTARPYLKILVEELLKKGCRLSVSYDPIDTEAVEEVLVEDSGECFFLCEDAAGLSDDVQKINMKRFVDFGMLCENKSEIKRAKNEYKNAQRMKEGLVMSATQCLSDAGKHHFELEKLYKKHMDFAALSKFCETFSGKLISHLLCDENL